MDQAEYANIYAQESTHFYYRSTHHLVLSLIQKYLPQLPTTKPTTHHPLPITILDAGCGTGLLASKLTHFGTVTGLDSSPTAIRYARKRGVSAKLGSITKLPFPANTFDLVTCIDVLYHRQVTSDLQAITEFARVLKPGGLLIIRTAAHPWLVTAHDLQVHTRHRYTKTELADLLAPFHLLKLSYVHLLLLPAVVCQFLLHQIFPVKPTSNVYPLPDFLNFFLTWLLTTESQLLNTINLPFGLGLIAACTKPKD